MGEYIVTSIPVRADQLSLTETMERVQKFEQKGKNGTGAVMFYLAKDCNTVEKPGFKKACGNI